jgi:hypothetical protein
LPGAADASASIEAVVGAAGGPCGVGNAAYSASKNAKLAMVSSSPKKSKSEDEDTLYGWRRVQSVTYLIRGLSPV